MGYRIATGPLIALFFRAALAQDIDRSTGAVLVSDDVLQQIPWEYPFDLPKGYVLPPAVDLSAWFPPAGDQFAQSSCSGWALGYGLTTYQNKRGMDRSLNSSSVADAGLVFSPSFLYDQLVSLNKDPDCSMGVVLADAILLACNKGCCPMDMFPFDSAAYDCLRSIPDSALVAALNYRMTRPLMLDARNFDQWKYHLSKGEPVVFTASIDSTFDRGFRSKGKMPFTWDMPTPQDWNGRVHHIMVCTGYDDADSCFIVLNSWGREWGLHGYVRIPYNTMDWTCSEAYVTDPGSTDESTLPFAEMERPKPRRSGAVKGGLASGTVYRIDDLAWRSLGIIQGGAVLLVEFVDPVTLRRVRTLDVREDQPTTFFHEGRFYSFEYTGRSFFSKTPHCTLLLDDPLQSEFRRRVVERIDLCEDGVINGP